jgi:hypothetical protein
MVSALAIIGSENVCRMTRTDLPSVFAYRSITIWCCGDALNLQWHGTSFKSRPVYLLHLFTFPFYLFVPVYRSCYVGLHCHSEPLGGVVNVRESSCASDAVQGYVPWRQKQQFARKGWYFSTKIHAEVYFRWIFWNAVFTFRKPHIQSSIWRPSLGLTYDAVFLILPRDML